MYTLLDGQLWDSNRISAGCQPGNLLRDPLRSQGINEPCTRFGMFRPFICINLVWCLQAATQSVNLHRRWRWRKVTEVLSTCQARQNVESLSQSWELNRVQMVQKVSYIFIIYLLDRWTTFLSSFVHNFVGFNGWKRTVSNAKLCCACCVRCILNSLMLYFRQGRIHRHPRAWSI